MLTPMTLIALLGFSAVVLCLDETPQKDNTAEIRKLNEENKAQLSRKRRSSDTSQLSLVLGPVQDDIPIKNIAYTEDALPALDAGIFDIPNDEFLPKDRIVSDVDLSLPESLAMIVDGLTNQRADKAPQASRSKRSWFHSWAGKRSAQEDDEADTEETGADKRGRFHSWSGKRTVGSLTNLVNDINKRTSFHAWSGKRALSNEDDSISDTNLSELGETKESTLEDWLAQALLDIAIGDGADKVSGDLMVENNNAEQRNKRQRFHSWSGKRSSQAGPGTDNKSSLDNVYIGEETLREHLAYLEKRRDILAYLRTIYEALIGTKLEPIKTGIESAQISMPKQPDSQTKPIQTQSTLSRTAASTKMRPLEKKKKTRSRKSHSFHSWAGKRSSLSAHLRYRRSASSVNSKNIENESENSDSKLNRSLDTTLNKTQERAGPATLIDSPINDEGHKPIISTASIPIKDHGEKISISKRGSSISDSFAISPSSQEYDVANNMPNQFDVTPSENDLEEKQYLSQPLFLPTSNEPSEWSYIVGEDRQENYPDDFVEAVQFVSDPAPIPEDQWIDQDYNGLLKRGSFHAWSGKKRSYSSDDQQDTNKRPAFHSWSGKRDIFSEMSKKPAFHSWSGKKRNGDIDFYDTDKRPAFHSWSGRKRNGDIDFYNTDKRPAFHSWSGKKRGGADLFSTEAYLNKRPAFHAWSGKRKRQGYDDIYNIESKRPAFHSWSGKKRALSPDAFFPEQVKRPAFHSWSGRKRNVESADFETEKRPAFHSWSGKKRNDQRDLMETDKRPAFHSWSGRKRDIADAFLSELSKRPAFHSWSGKRSDGGDYSINKRPAFHAWSGRRKRDTSDLSKRPSFHSWSGKKRDGNNSPSEVSKRPAFHAWSGKKRAGPDCTEAAIDKEKRPAFHSWSGKKRSGEGVDFSELEKRPAFHAWSGKKRSKEISDLSDLDKRPAFHSWSGKKRSGESIGFSDVEKRPAFHAWSGKKKRSEIDFLSQVADKRPAFHSWSGKKRDGADNFPLDMFKRPAFHSWSGKKRSDPELDKRPAFHSWSGKKRSNVDADVDKRPAFHAWSGKKRASVDNFEQELEKRPAFHAWSGKKRSDAQMLHGSELERRASFHAWSGKKRDGTDGFTSELDKRPSFHSWSGKRDITSSVLSELDKRPAFHSWSGKKRDGSEVPFPDMERRSGFHSWSGRRRRDNTDLSDVVFLPMFGENQNQDVSKGASNLGDVFPNGFLSETDLSPALDKSSPAETFLSQGGITPGSTSTNEELSKRASFHSWSGKKRGYELTSLASHQLGGLQHGGQTASALDAQPAKRPAFHSWSGKRAINPVGEVIEDKSSPTQIHLSTAKPNHASHTSNDIEEQSQNSRLETQKAISAETGPPSMT